MNGWRLTAKGEPPLVLQENGKNMNLVQAVREKHVMREVILTMPTFLYRIEAYYAAASDLLLVDFIKISKEGEIEKITVNFNIELQQAIITLEELIRSKPIL